MDYHYFFSFPQLRKCSSKSSFWETILISFTTEVLKKRLHLALCDKWRWISLLHYFLIGNFITQMPLLKRETTFHKETLLPLNQIQNLTISEIFSEECYQMFLALVHLAVETVKREVKSWAVLSLYQFAMADYLGVVICKAK